VVLEPLPRRFKAEAIRRVCKGNTNGHPWNIDETCALDIAAEQREQIYEAAWETGDLRFRDNVTLVDLRETPVERIVPEGIRLRDGSVYALDVLVFATGFDAMAGLLLKLDMPVAIEQHVDGSRTASPTSAPRASRASS
jgi:cation diffusion facilitator CzcD-associated flavoprotein CzcO